MKFNDEFYNQIKGTVMGKSLLQLINFIDGVF